MTDWEEYSAVIESVIRAIVWARTAEPNDPKTREIVEGLYRALHYLEDGIT